MAIKRTFKQEIKRQARLAIAAAVGFIIAFAWKDAIFDTAVSYVSRILDVAPDHYLTHTYTAVALTLVGVLIILSSSKILHD